jgi:hypothetical protein
MRAKAVVVAAYIDLNPVRAKIVGDPKDYRWSGYGEAVAGRKRALENQRVATTALRPEGMKHVSAEKVLAEYRCYVSVKPRAMRPS